MTGIIPLVFASIVVLSCPTLPALPVARGPAGPELENAAQEPAIRRPAGIYAVLPLEEDAPTPRSRKRSDPNRTESLLKNEAVAVSAVLAEPIGPEQNSGRQVGL